MTFHGIDWAILAAVTALLYFAGLRTRRYMQSVADFLAANRCAGKYILGISDGIAGLGAISIVAIFEMNYKAGFTATWWGMMLLPVSVIIATTGWVQYRFRQTRAMTMAQFFEMRYSRHFRIYAGIVGFLSGLVNFGIFPSVSARFFQYYCGFPTHYVDVFGLQIDLVYGAIMLVLEGTALSFVFLGGQIAVMVTDFIQGVWVNVTFIVLGVYLLFFVFDWSHILEAAALAPPDASLINPLKTTGTQDFNVSYFLIGVFGAFYSYMAWQGNQGYFGAARTPHEAQMGRVIGQFRYVIQTMPLVLLPMAAWAFLHHPDFAVASQGAQQALEAVDNPQLRSQLTVTVSIAHILPVGILGLFGALMLAAYISTDDTYMHSWGSIFIQDVVMPIRQNLLKRGNHLLPPKLHIRWLRRAIFGVALYIFVFSLVFSHRQDILMFFALTGTIYLGWAGAAIVGGLYWKYGNSAGAWCAAIGGVTLALAGWYLTYYWASSQHLLSAWVPGLWGWSLQQWPQLQGDRFPVNAQILWFCTMLVTLGLYVAGSLVGGRGRAYNMDRLLHRGAYAVLEPAGAAPEATPPQRGWKALRMGREFTRVDRIVYVASYVYIVGTFGTFVVGTALMFATDVADASWGRFWWYYCLIMLLFSAVVTVWISLGGARDLRALLSTLKVLRRDHTDDGTVVGQESLADRRQREEAQETGG
ncbi:MAG: sodium:solute symporter [Candidatus Latescibacterota bacterium]